MTFVKVRGRKPPRIFFIFSRTSFEMGLSQRSADIFERASVQIGVMRDNRRPSQIFNSRVGKSVSRNQGGNSWGPSSTSVGSNIPVPSRRSFLSTFGFVLRSNLAILFIGKPLFRREISHWVSPSLHYTFLFHLICCCSSCPPRSRLASRKTNSGVLPRDIAKSTGD